MVKSLSQVELNTVCAEKIWAGGTKQRASVPECNALASTQRGTACRDFLKSNVSRRLAALILGLVNSSQCWFPSKGKFSSADTGLYFHPHFHLIRYKKFFYVYELTQRP
jgi:hypothetical protein